MLPHRRVARHRGHSSPVCDRRNTGLYAAAGIAECWSVDLAARVVEAYSAPSSGGYAAQPPPPRPASSAGAVPDLELAVAELMPAS